MSTHATYALGQSSKGDAVRPAQASRREQPHVEHGKIVPAEFAQILGNEVAVSKRKLGDNRGANEGSQSRTTPQDVPHYAANASPEATAQAMPQESRLPNTRQSTLPAIPRQETPLAAPPASRQGAPRTKRPQESPRAARQGTPQTPRQTASRILQTPSSISGERLPSQENAPTAPAHEGRDVSTQAPALPGRQDRATQGVHPTHDSTTDTAKDERQREIDAAPDAPPATAQRREEPPSTTTPIPGATHTAQTSARATQEHPRSGRSTAARGPGNGTSPRAQMEKATSEPRGQHTAETFREDKEKIAVEPSLPATRVAHVSETSLESPDHAEVPSGRNPAPSAETVSAIPQQASLSHGDAEPKRTDDKAPILQSAVAAQATSAQHQRASHPSNAARASAARASDAFPAETSSSAQVSSGAESAGVGSHTSFHTHERTEEVSSAAWRTSETGRGDEVPGQQGTTWEPGNPHATEEQHGRPEGSALGTRRTHQPEPVAGRTTTTAHDVPKTSTNAAHSPYSSPALANPPLSREAKTSDAHPPLAPAELLQHTATTSDTSWATAHATLPAAVLPSHATRASDTSSPTTRATVPAAVLPHSAFPSTSSDASIAVAHAAVPAADLLPHADQADDASHSTTQATVPRSGHATTSAARGTTHAQPSAPTSQSAQDPIRSESATPPAQPASRKGQPSATVAPAPVDSATNEPQQVAEQSPTEAASIRANAKPRFQELPLTHEAQVHHGGLPLDASAPAEKTPHNALPTPERLPHQASLAPEVLPHRATAPAEALPHGATAPAEGLPHEASVSTQALPHEASVPAPPVSVPAHALPRKATALDGALPGKPSAGAETLPHRASLPTTLPIPEKPTQNEKAPRETDATVEGLARETPAHTDPLPHNPLPHTEAQESPRGTTVPAIPTATSERHTSTRVESTSESTSHTKDGKASAPVPQHSDHHEEPASQPIPASASHDHATAAETSAPPAGPRATNTLAPASSNLAPTSSAAHTSPTPKSASLPQVSPPTSTTGVAGTSRAQRPSTAEASAGHEANEPESQSGSAHEQIHASPPEAALDDSARTNASKPKAAETTLANHPIGRVASTRRATEKGAASADSTNGQVKSPAAHKDHTTQSVVAADSILADPSLQPLLSQTGATAAPSAETRSTRAAHEKNAAAESSPSKTVQGAAEPSNSPRTVPPPSLFAPSDRSPAPFPQPTLLVANHETAAADSAATPTAPTARAAIIDRAVEDPGLSVNVMPHSAHLSITSSAGDLALHVRVRDGSADVSVSGAMAPLFDSKAPQVRTALAGEGLSLGSFATDQQGGFQGRQGQPESAPRTTDTQPHPTTRRPSTSEPEVRIADDRRIHVTA